MSRVLLFDRPGSYVGDLDVEGCDVAEFHEVVNGEHSVSIENSERLDEGMRLLHKDATGKVREWVIDDVEETHELGGLTRTYGGTWSMQYDLDTEPGGEIWVSANDGTHDPIPASQALAKVLDGSSWETGAVTLSKSAACSLYDGSRWEYLKKLVEVFGGEMEPRIVVDGFGNVTHRYVTWGAHVGSSVVRRRFDFGHDCTSIKRTLAPGPRYTRILPRGGSAKTDDDGVDYSDRCGIEDMLASDMPSGWTSQGGGVWTKGDLKFTIGTDYIEDVSAAALFDSGDHPTKVVTFDLETEDDVEELFIKAADAVTEWTRPKVTYESGVDQFAAAGMDAHGVALGDEVHIVDLGFGDSPLRIENRIVEKTVNLKDESDVDLVVGEAVETLTDSLSKIRQDMESVVSDVTRGGTIVYVNDLLEKLNEEVNARGGYTYLLDGHGAVSYDVAVSNPLIGSEASYVTQMKGGALRIANSKKAQFSGINDWNWKSLIESGHITTELVTAAHLEAGYIHDAANNVNIDLDNGNLTFKRGLIQSADGRSSWNLTSSTFKVVDADVTGKITATSGEIGGFTISSGALYTGDDVTAKASGCVALSSAPFTREIDDVSRSGLRFAIGSKFAVTGNGTLYASSAHVSGTITATSGEIGGLKISSSAIYSGSSVTSNADGAVALSSATFTRTVDGESRSDLHLAIGRNFAVDKTGKLYASGVVVSGQIDATSGEIGGFTITGTSISNSSMRLASTGMFLKRDGIEIGSIGTNNMTGQSAQRGLVFDLNVTGSYMAWAAQNTTNGTYMVKMLYANQSTANYVTGRLSFGCDVDLCDYKAYNFWIDPNTGGASGGETFTIRFVQVLGMNDDGRASRWGDSAYLTFKNGLCTGVSYYT
jgi:hypothetical protein